jgi:acyl-CoA thioesterase-1
MHIGELDHRQGQRSPGGGGRIQGEMDCRRRPSKATLLATAILAMALQTAPAWACRLTVLGDSLAAGYGVGELEAFPVRLHEALRQLGVECEVVNAGVSGDTSAGGLARLDWILADQPTHLLVELGGNDALRGLPVEQLRANLSQIVATAQARGVEVILAGMLAPPNLGRKYGEAFQQVYSDVAREYRVPLYPFFLDGAALSEGMMQPDGIHPTARGVDVIADRIAPLVAKQIQED